MMRFLATLALVGCATPQAPSFTAAEQRARICNGGPTQHIRYDDPGLAVFTERESLADRKVRLAIERTNAC